MKHKGRMLLALLVFHLFFSTTWIRAKDDDPVIGDCGIQTLQPILMDTCDKYHREHLKEALREDYDNLYAGLLEHKKAIRLEHVEHLETLFRSVNLDHPELFWCDYDYQVKILADPVTEVYHTYLLPVYETKQKDVAPLQKKLEEATVPILKKARVLPDDYAKVKYVYDEILDHTQYKDVEKNNQNILSLFLGHKTVCAGYAKGMKYLLDQLGIPCSVLLVQDRSDPDQGHVINLVKLDGQYYYMDATYGDSQTEASYHDMRYEYFGMTSDEMLRIYEPKEAYVKTKATRDSFFARENLILHTYDEGAIRKLLARYIHDSNPCVSIKCANQNVYRQVKQLMGTSDRIWQLFEDAGYASAHLQYYEDDHLYTFFLNYW